MPDDQEQQQTSSQEPPQQNHPWTLKSLVDAFPNLSVVIDLTATYKYYRPKNLKVKHVKILTEGHVVPKKSVVKKYVNTETALMYRNVPKYQKHFIFK